MSFTTQASTQESYPKAGLISALIFRRDVIKLALVRRVIKLVFVAGVFSNKISQINFDWFLLELLEISQQTTHRVIGERYPMVYFNKL